MPLVDRNEFRAETEADEGDIDLLGGHEKRALDGKTDLAGGEARAMRAGTEKAVNGEFAPRLSIAALHATNLKCPTVIPCAKPRASERLRRRASRGIRLPDGASVPSKSLVRVSGDAPRQPFSESGSREVESDFQGGEHQASFGHLRLACTSRLFAHHDAFLSPRGHPRDKEAERAGTRQPNDAMPPKRSFDPVDTIQIVAEPADVLRDPTTSLG
ncbi:MAG: hypothetical protein WCF18_03245 [Chthoniobacteraceae bacterium]